eukprot:9100794-Ditylum_brightwellii.AAC.1
MSTIDLNMVNVDYKIPAVYQLQEKVLVIINDATRDMHKLLSNSAIQATGASPFCWHFASTSELINAYSSYTGAVDNVDLNCHPDKPNDVAEKQAEDARVDEALLMSTLQ